MDTLFGFADLALPSFAENLWVRNLLISAAFVAALLGVRYLVNRFVVPSLPTVEERRRWQIVSGNTTVLVLVLGLAAVWANAIQSFLLSVIALVAALVISNKELLLCMAGSFLRAVSDAYSLGDRIEWGAVRGDVIDLSLLTTTVLEVGPGSNFHMPTGRTVVVPNLKMLDTPVFNESKTGKYVVHTLRIPLNMTDDLDLAQQVALEAIQDVCGEHLEAARLWMESLEHTHNFIHTPSAQPRVYLSVPEPNRVDMLLRFPAPVRWQGRLEQAILRQFLVRYSRVPASARVDAPQPSEGETKPGELGR